MSNIKFIDRKNHSIKVVTTNNQKDILSSDDIAMDGKAKDAVKVAIEIAQRANKPIAKYDIKTKKAYIEYSTGVIKYIEKNRD